MQSTISAISAGGYLSVQKYCWKWRVAGVI